ncbi:cation:proton antiporter [Cytophagaceae bacterium YF14B1]|uniref:Cation:proton antiporter n=1 Tax=Xanthocytophaga flava TaxID=3048013 RepID=A0AAE3QM93_9BACT|nr:cation:proton antiporter [Xanthocytophaga flavus]MDJ1479531.1 cation:proton antiporter [Xanthocytophaga flavus]
MSHVPQLIIDLALILGAAGVTTLLFKVLKQPLVLGYILAGVLVGPNFSLFPTITDIETIRIWADIGVIFLLFGLGLEFSFKKLVEVGGTSSITGIFEVGAMLLLGYGTGKLLGWSRMDSLFLGGIIAISSTTIIIRAFEELNVKSQKFAGLVFGILVIEDLVAILLLVLLSTLAASQQFAGMQLLTSILKLAFFLTVWFLAGIYLIPTFLRKIRKHMTDEMLLVISIALCLLMVVLVTEAGFSAALGAFVMGSILSETIFVEKIEHMMQPVKNLFGAVFFVSVGMLIDYHMLIEHAGPIMLIAGVVIVGKSLNVTLGALISGQPLKQAVQTGMSLTQIGEFSFIIATLGLTLKVTSDFLYPVAVAVSAVTTFTTPYMIRLAEPVCHQIDKWLPTRWRAFLNSYSSGTQTITHISDWQGVLKNFAQIIILNTVVIVGIILLTTYFLTDVIKTKLVANSWGNVVTAFIALTLMLPFLWALSVRRIRTHSYNALWSNRIFNRGPLVALEAGRVIIGIVLVGFLLDQLFSPLIAFVSAILLIGVVLPLFTQRLQQTYARIEKRFLYNLTAKSQPEELAPVKSQLLPWDAHLTQFEISPDSQIIGQTLTELAFRERYGVNVAQIERGSRVILAPRGNEHVYPADTLTVVGTDAQLKQFRTVVEPLQNNQTVVVPDVTLKQLVVDNKFPFLGKSIRESLIREKTKGIVIGIERNGNRIINPDPSTVFENGDLIWLAGEKHEIKSIE